MGRKRLKLDESSMFKLASIGCTMIEMADFFGCSVHTLERHYMDVVTEGRANFKTSLRRHQYLKAQEGSDTMLIWLGKQHLGQNDSREITIKGPDYGAIDQKLRTLLDGEVVEETEAALLGEIESEGEAAAPLQVERMGETKAADTN